MTASAFTCPECGWTSHHPQDAEHGYCGHCHTFTGRVEVKPPTVKQLGDPRREGTWTLLPGPAGVCSQCGVDHEPDAPHNRETLRYQYSFYAEHNRWPNWADAMAHCTPEVQELWTVALRERGVTEDQLTPMEPPRE